MGGTMCSYNAVNDVPSCANSVFNNDVLRKMFGFSGMIVSDCSAILGILKSHNYTKNLDDTVRAGLRGGTDLNCGDVYYNYGASAFGNGTITMSDIDTALARVLEQFYKVGLGENPVPWSDLDERDIDSPTSRGTALNAAQQGMVLLRNEDALLPLKAKVNDGKIKIAVLGPHLNSSTQLLANYYGDNVLVKTSTPLAALARRPEVEVVGALAGCDLINTSIPADLSGAATLAKRADFAVVFLGLHSTQGAQVHNGPGMEREGFDRTNLTLPGFQEPLIKAIVATATPTVVVFINSGGIAAEWVYNNVPAVLEAYYPGELGGDAIASLLLGDVSPSGRLTTTIYPADFVIHRNITDMEFRPHGDIPGITYRFAEPTEALYSFGYGMGYTTFEFTFATAPPATISTEGICDRRTEMSIRLTAKNIGRMTSDVSVLCFVLSNVTASSPPRRLAGFGRASSVIAGGEASVDVDILPAALRWSNGKGDSFAAPHQFELHCGGEPDGFARVTVQVTGPRCAIFDMPDM
mmetsp:Transcript_17924/g.53118  ORF Transcript_17924/g.53118 Transcript_17924/m.53118 type:complete len:523 (-) Transcript_17924:1600-3168(-)